MRICEIILWNNDPAEANGSNPHLDLPPGPLNSDVTNVASAFTRNGRVKRLWNLIGSAEQPSGPAPRDAETDLIPSGTVEPTLATVQAEPVEEVPPVGLHRLVPFRPCRGVSGDLAHFIETSARLRAPITPKN